MFLEFTLTIRARIGSLVFLLIELLGLGFWGLLGDVGCRSSLVDPKARRLDV